ncbi:hypothetical protein NST50_31255 [Paenibacillus sp. FSL E2-0202]
MIADVLWVVEGDVLWVLYDMRNAVGYERWTKYRERLRCAVYSG